MGKAGVRSAGVLHRAAPRDQALCAGGAVSDRNRATGIQVDLELDIVRVGIVYRGGIPSIGWKRLLNSCPQLLKSGAAGDINIRIVGSEAGSRAVDKLIFIAADAEAAACQPVDVQRRAQVEGDGGRLLEGCHSTGTEYMVCTRRVHYPLCADEGDNGSADAQIHGIVEGGGGENDLSVFHLGSSCSAA